jgi:hypothetical protein
MLTLGNLKFLNHHFLCKSSLQKILDFYRTFVL